MPPEDEPQSLFDLFGRYKKAVVTLVSSLLVWGTGVAESASTAPTALEWIGLGIAVVGTATVAKVTNK